MDITAGLAAAASALQIAKEIRGIDRGFDVAEMKAKVAEVMSSLADVRIALSDASAELEVREKEIARLRSAFAIRAELVDHRGYKYEKRADGGPMGEPFCPRCEQNLGRYYRLNMAIGGIYVCPECQAKYSRIQAFLWDGE